MATVYAIAVVITRMVAVLTEVTSNVEASVNAEPLASAIFAFSFSSHPVYNTVNNKMSGVVFYSSGRGNRYGPKPEGMQDRILYHSTGEYNVFVLADGHGKPLRPGGPAGHTAAEAASIFAMDSVLQGLDGGLSAEELDFNGIFNATRDHVVRNVIRADRTHGTKEVLFTNPEAIGLTKAGVVGAMFYYNITNTKAAPVIADYGTTLIVFVLHSSTGRYIMAHCGDGYVVILNKADGSTRSILNEHTLDNDAEKKRLIDFIKRNIQQGKVCIKGNRYCYPNNNKNTSIHPVRGIHDWGYNYGIICKPEITTGLLGPDDIVGLSTDGIPDFASMMQRMCAPLITRSDIVPRGGPASVSAKERIYPSLDIPPRGGSSCMDVDGDRGGDRDSDGDEEMVISDPMERFWINVESELLKLRRSESASADQDNWAFGVIIP